eukprot:8548580-Pyramimonas_sp.AAC.1
MLSPTRPPSGPNRPDGAQDPMDSETRAYAHRVLIHPRAQAKYSSLSGPQGHQTLGHQEGQSRTGWRRRTLETTIR